MNKKGEMSEEVHDLKKACKQDRQRRVNHFQRVSKYTNESTKKLKYLK